MTELEADKDPTDRAQVSQSIEWLSNHGQPSRGELMRLAQEDTPEARERLQQLAEDNDIAFTESSDLVTLAEQISSALEQDDNTGVDQ